MCTLELGYPENVAAFQAGQPSIADWHIKFTEPWVQYTCKAQLKVACAEPDFESPRLDLEVWQIDRASTAELHGLDAASTVGETKELIAKASGTPPSLQLFMLGTQVLENNRCLWEVLLLQLAGSQQLTLTFGHAAPRPRHRRHGLLSTKLCGDDSV